MVEKKYKKYIFTEADKIEEEFKEPKRIADERKKGNYLEAARMFALDNRLVQGAFYINN